MTKSKNRLRFIFRIEGEVEVVHRLVRVVETRPGCAASRAAARCARLARLGPDTRSGRSARHRFGLGLAQSGLERLRPATSRFKRERCNRLLLKAAEPPRLKFRTWIVGQFETAWLVRQDRHTRKLTHFIWTRSRPALCYCAFTFWKNTSGSVWVWPEMGSRALIGSVIRFRVSPHAA